VIKSAIHKSLRLFGLDLIHFPPREKERPPDFRDDEAEIVRAVRPWTSTSPERIYALIQAVRYVSSNRVAGAIVECGVWKGGSMAAVSRALLQTRDVSRDLYLFDTFEGMTEPSAKDIDYSGKGANDVMREDSGYRCADAPLK
jgi:O-methyltransferase